LARYIVQHFDVQVKSSDSQKTAGPHVALHRDISGLRTWSKCQKTRQVL